jgi:hypothetical protein
MTKRTLGFVIVCGLMVSGPLWAHHSLSGVYDIRAQGEVTGVVVKMQFMNPHGAMTLEVENDDGTKTEWVLTTGGANVLASAGFGRGGLNTVQAGDVVTVRYLPARNGRPLGFIRSITLPDNREVDFEID